MFNWFKKNELVFEQPRDEETGHFEGVYKGYEFSGKMFEIPSHMGIGGWSRISKLVICKDGKEVLAFDRGDYVEPKGLFDRKACSEIIELLEEVNTNVCCD